MPYFSRTKDLKEQLERALNEMQELKSARDRQATMVCFIIFYIIHKIQKTEKILTCTFIKPKKKNIYVFTVVNEIL